MKNQWYFQSTLANIPLFMLRTSAASLDHWFIGTRDKSTNITILTLNTSVIFHRNWDKGTQPYYANVVGTQKVWLYATDQSASPIFNEIKLKNLIFLGKHTTQHTRILLRRILNTLPQNTQFHNSRRMAKKC